MRLPRPSLLLLLMVAVLLTLALVPAPLHTQLHSALLDAAHVPAFGAFAWVTLRLAQRSPRWSRGSRARPYLLAFAVTAAVGTLTELSQGLDRRDASLLDGLRNLAGGGIALLLALALDRQAAAALRLRGLFRGALLAAACALLVLALRPAAVVVSRYRQREAAFPELCDFRSPWLRSFLGSRHTAIRATEAPAAWESHRGQDVVRVTLWAGGTPALILREVHPDWSGYDRLVFEAFSDSLRPREIELRIDDAHHDNDYFDRFNRTLVLKPGANRYEVPLSEVERAPRTRKLDLKRVRSLTLFLAEPSRTCTLYLDAFRLERD